MPMIRQTERSQTSDERNWYTCRSQQSPARRNRTGSSDLSVALDIQREEYREHLRAMVNLLNSVASDEAHDAAAADVDGMSYEELQALGETIGKVKV